MESYFEAFRGRPSVTREEIAQHFSENMPVVEEKVLGTPSPEQMKGLRDEYARAEYGENFSGLASEYKRRIDDLIMDRRSTTKFGQYTLPGGENYREVLLKTPNKQELDFVFDWFDPSNQTGSRTRFATQAEAQAAANAAAEKAAAIAQKNFDEAMSRLQKPEASASEKKKSQTPLRPRLRKLQEKLAA